MWILYLGSDLCAFDIVSINPYHVHDLGQTDILEMYDVRVVVSGELLDSYCV